MTTLMNEALTSPYFHFFKLGYMSKTIVKQSVGSSQLVHLSKIRSKMSLDTNLVFRFKSQKLFLQFCSLFTKRSVRNQITFTLTFFEALILLITAVIVHVSN